MQFWPSLFILRNFNVAVMCWLCIWQWLSTSVFKYVVHYNVKPVTRWISWTIIVLIPKHLPVFHSNWKRQKSMKRKREKKIFISFIKKSFENCMILDWIAVRNVWQLSFTFLCWRKNLFVNRIWMVNMCI